jgi:hypothetical protein
MKEATLGCQGKKGRKEAEDGKIEKEGSLFSALSSFLGSREAGIQGPVS